MGNGYKEGTCYNEHSPGPIFSAGSSLSTDIKNGGNRGIHPGLEFVKQLQRKGRGEK